jgi:hypothetical protein
MREQRHALEIADKILSRPSLAGDARAEALEEALQIIEQEPELEGEPPAHILAEMQNASPVLNARAAVRATKKSIARKIRALLKSLPLFFPAIPKDSK